MQHLWTAVKTLPAEVFGTALCGPTNRPNTNTSSLAIVRQEAPEARIDSTFADKNPWAAKAHPHRYAATPSRVGSSAPCGT
jgi:hypothetical protein